MSVKRHTGHAGKPRLATGIARNIGAPAEMARKLGAGASIDHTQVPDGVWEALQRMIEDGLLRGGASAEDARTVQQYRDRVHFFSPPQDFAQREAPVEVPADQGGRNTHAKASNAPRSSG